MFDREDLKYMNLALRLAKKAEGLTSPNPLVGAVVVKKGEIIGKGYHRKAGMPHAEIEAFADAKKKGHSVVGSELYVTLEPCCHSGKRTPPCTESILENKISKVYVGTLDQNPEVSGKSIKTLKNKGVELKVGLLEDKCKEANEIFFKYITNKVPFVILKLASTFDGKIATISGDSKWIGSEKQREFAHGLRNSVDAVLVGVNTVMKDDTRLNVRLNRKNISQPIPVILDSSLRIPLKSKVFKVHSSCIIATTQKAKRRGIKSLEERGCKVLVMKEDKYGNVMLKELLKKLGQMQITSVLIEGGSQVASSALREKIVDKLVFFYSPKIVGGDGLSMISSLGINNMKRALSIKDVRTKKFGTELMIEGYL